MKNHTLSTLQNHKIGIVIAALGIALVLAKWGQMLGMALLASIVLPVWVLLLPSIFIISCVALASFILSISSRTDKKTKLDLDQSVASPESPETKRDDEEWRRAA